MSKCDEEPCKSLIDQYWAKAIAGWEAELVLRLHCDVWKAALRHYWVLFSIWLAVFAHAMMCATLHLPPIACTALTGASIALLLALLVWGIRIVRLRLLIGDYEKACSLLYSEMLSLRRQIAVLCPRECQPEAVRIRCSC
jgi:hypothetical protein